MLRVYNTATRKVEEFKSIEEKKLSVDLKLHPSGEKNSLINYLNIIKDLEDSLEKWNYDKLNETYKISRYIKEQLKNYM